MVERKAQWDNYLNVQLKLLGHKNVTIAYFSCNLFPTNHNLISNLVLNFELILCELLKTKNVVVLN